MKVSNLKGSKTTGKPDPHSNPGVEGRTLSQNPSRKHVLDKPPQPKEPQWGEDRLSKDLKLENFRGTKEISNKLIVMQGRQAFLSGNEVLAEQVGRGRECGQDGGNGVQTAVRVDKPRPPLENPRQDQKGREITQTGRIPPSVTALGLK